MTIKSLIQSGKELLAEAKALTPAVTKIVNDIRGAAHVAGVLTPKDEAEFQSLADRFRGYIVKGTLGPLPATHPETGEAITPLAPLVPPSSPESAAAMTPDPKKAAYDAGFAIGQARGTLPADASDDTKAGYLAGLSTGGSATPDKPMPTGSGTSPAPVPPEPTPVPEPAKETPPAEVPPPAQEAPVPPAEPPPAPEAEPVPPPAQVEQAALPTGTTGGDAGTTDAPTGTT